jgi:prepilin-type N-terminal cleavage/methylation domain-containing protein
MTMRKNASQAGFTLVELSIVLVIIGLIIGGVLTGRQIMLNAQITNAVNSVQAYQAQFQTYVQNYGAMPGDDAIAQSRFSSANVPNLGNGDGTLNGKYDSATDTDETRLVWADLRAAGLVKGAGSNTAQPTNPFGGLYGFQRGAFTGSDVLTTNVLCLSGVPGEAAMSVDSRLDDGIRNTGSVMGGSAVDGAVTDAVYDSAQTYVVCVKM